MPIPRRRQQSLQKQPDASRKTPIAVVLSVSCARIQGTKWVARFSSNAVSFTPLSPERIQCRHLSAFLTAIDRSLVSKKLFFETSSTPLRAFLDNRLSAWSCLSGADQAQVLTEALHTLVVGSDRIGRTCWHKTSPCCRGPTNRHVCCAHACAVQLGLVIPPPVSSWVGWSR